MQITLFGENGGGIGHAAHFLGRMLSKHGLHVVSWRDRPARIRGGFSSHTVRACHGPFGLAESDDIAICLGSASQVEFNNIRATRFTLRVLPVMSEAESVDQSSVVDISQSTLDAAGLGENNHDAALFAIGIVAVLLNLSSRDSEVNSLPHAFIAGESYGREAFASSRISDRYVQELGTPSLYLTGNEVVAAAALGSQCRFIAAYPITPATEVFEEMQKRLPLDGGSAVLAEDEIAAINMAIGASVAGVRAMTVTSGPGMSLMTEGLGFAAMIEVPLVLIHCSRGGPSTGMPTRQEQSDVNHLLFAGHGEFTRIVLAPSTAQQIIADVNRAFNLADEFQCPVIVLLDQMMSVDRSSVPLGSLSFASTDRGDQILTGRVDPGYRRYRPTSTGTSLRVVPGVEEGMHISSGSEHDQFGRPDDSAKNRMLMIERRAIKAHNISEKLGNGIAIFGSSQATLAMVTFGSSVGPAQEARVKLADSGLDVKLVQLRVLWPFPERALQQALGKSSHIFVVEQNSTGQVLRLLRSVVPPENLSAVSRSDGRPFRPTEIISAILQRVGATV